MCLGCRKEAISSDRDQIVGYVQPFEQKVGGSDLSSLFQHYNSKAGTRTFRTLCSSF